MGILGQFQDGFPSVPLILAVQHAHDQQHSRFVFVREIPVLQKFSFVMISSVLAS